MSRHEPSLARRIAPAIALTGAGFALVQALDNVAPIGAATSAPLGDQSQLAVPGATTTPVDTSLPGQAVATTVPPTPVTAGSTGGASTRSNNSQQRVPQQQSPATVPAQSAAPQETIAPQANSAPAATASPATTAAPAPSPTAAPAQPATNDCGAIVKTGSTTSIEWRRFYGTIAVTAKFTSAKVLCDASASWQANDSKSQSIDAYAVPYLNQQAVSSRSANIQGVSGATAVSVAYAQSLQSAIDSL